MLFADRIGTRLAIGWTMGTLVSALGCYFSVYFDLPTGATIVCTFGAVLVCMAIAKAFFFKVREPDDRIDRVAHPVVPRTGASRID